MTEVFVEATYIATSWLILIQTFELFNCSWIWRANGISPWPIEKFRVQLPHLLLCRLIVTIVGLFFLDKNTIPLFALLQIVLYLPISLHFTNRLGGGSESMTYVLLIGLSLISIEIHDKSIGHVWIATNTLVTYYRAGIQKYKNLSWRNGSALLQFLSYSSYSTPPLLLNLTRRYRKIISWMIILLEIVLPITCAIFAKAFLVVILFGTIFHAINIYLFGLNMFFWAWIATYPSLMYLYMLSSISSGK